MKIIKRIIIALAILAFVIAIFLFAGLVEYNAFKEKYSAIVSTENENLKEQIALMEIQIQETNQKLDVITTELEEIKEEISALHIEEPTQPTQPIETETEEEPVPILLEEGVTWASDYRVYSTCEITELAGGEEFDIDFLAKLLYCEAGATSWECQVYTCSAILNLCDLQGKSLWALGHNQNVFSVAPWVDSAKPTQVCYEVIDYVLNGGRVENICYFRTGNYHTFGTPVCKAGNHYFSM